MSEAVARAPSVLREAVEGQGWISSTLRIRRSRGVQGSGRLRAVDRRCACALGCAPSSNASRPVRRYFAAVRAAYTWEPMAKALQPSGHLEAVDGMPLTGHQLSSMVGLGAVVWLLQTPSASSFLEV